MKVTFYSNFMNHHQLPFSKAVYKLTKGNYHFVACSPIEQERLNMGYEDMNKKYNFIIRPYESLEQKKLAEKLAIESDVMIFGSGDEHYMKMRLKENKLVFRYSERLFKGKMTLKRWIRGYIGTYIHYARFLKHPFYLLCASAYTSTDLNKFFNFKNRVFKWGYFPEVKKYEDIDTLISEKEKNSIVWVARMIDWKHPEIPVMLAKKLREAGYDFEMNLIGNGMMEGYIKETVDQEGLDCCVNLLGAMSPDKVREYMEESQMFIFTSDSNEGWGAVLNEAMNSCCACVASDAIGSVPFLIDNEKNGLIYKNGEIEDLFNKVKILLDDSEYSSELGKNAYSTLNDEWNAECAAKRLLILSEQLINNVDREIFKTGPCSSAEVI